MGTVMAHDSTTQPAMMFSTSNMEVLGTRWTQLNISVINPRHNCLLMGCQKENKHQYHLSRKTVLFFCHQDNGAEVLLIFMHIT
jgi:hypothetical protein